MAIDPALFKSGMRCLASGVSIVTSLGPDGPRGMTATAICSVSVSPPTLLCCVNRAASLHETIRASGVLAVNLLVKADQALADRFAALEAAESRFALGRWTRLRTGAPILETALAAFDCRVVETVDSASHSIFIAEVVDARSGAAAAPLLYFDGGYGDFVATETLTSNS
jgi:flavin reductase